MTRVRARRCTDPSRSIDVQDHDLGDCDGHFGPRTPGLPHAVGISTNAAPPSQACLHHTASDHECASRCEQCPCRPRSVVRVASSALGTACPCLVTKPVRAFLGRAGLPRSNGSGSVEPRPTAKRPTTQSENNLARADPPRSSRGRENLVRRSARTAWRLHDRLLVQAVRAADGRVLYDGSARPALDAEAGPHCPHQSLETR